MARSLSNALLVLMAFAALIQISSAQTSYIVGDALGWSVPGSPSIYTNWASGKKFNVGDVLVFRFTTGTHDVTEVTKAAFDACNPASPITKETNGPANITLNKPGEHYFICGIPGHCNAGQKLHVTVSAASAAPAPRPNNGAAPPRAAASAPTPTQAPSTQPSAAASPAPGPAAGTETPSSAPSPATSAAAPSGGAISPSTGANSPSGSTTPSVPSAQSPGGGAAPPTEASFASSLGVSGLYATFLTAVVAFLLY